MALSVFLQREFFLAEKRGRVRQFALQKNGKYCQKKEKVRYRKATKGMRKNGVIFGQFSEYISLHAKYMYAKMKTRVRV